uniref:Uncharacterized protein n=1 Tax=Ralstonia solanacearum TaxID=305 RepID=A0A0S4UQX1_RALSL|nr:protein of unknown function [Ralstonia solanacearum]CUV35097.1 protein of unknown function [Ralstonia solanacearum]CUV41094.1 protein of unknown function [Ralstonia solanacearum]CUV61547.1 protein of unknown function [Ralstonia solanacearum]
MEKEHREREAKLAGKTERYPIDGRRMGRCAAAAATRGRRWGIRPYNADGQGRNPRLRG